MFVQPKRSSPVASARVTTVTVSRGPTADDIALSVDATAAISLPLAGSDIDAGDSIEQYRVDSRPANGTLTLGGSPVGIGTLVSAVEIAAGDLVFTSAGGFSGTTSFAFSAHDGDAWSVASVTATIDVTIARGIELILPTGGEDATEDAAEESESFGDDEQNPEEGQTESEDIGSQLDLGELTAPGVDLRLGATSSELPDPYADGELLGAESLLGEARLEDPDRSRDSDERIERATQRGPWNAARQLDLEVPQLNGLAERLAHQLAEQIEAEQASVSPVQAVSVALSSTLLAVLARSGSLMAMALGSLPAWRYFDPLAVVSIPDTRKRAWEHVLREAEDEDAESEGRLREVLGG